MEKTRDGEITAVSKGGCITIPLGTQFQFRSFGPEPLSALGVTMPPWSGTGVAIVVAGKWSPAERQVVSSGVKRAAGALG